MKEYLIKQALPFNIVHSALPRDQGMSDGKNGYNFVKSEHHNRRLRH